MKNTLFSNSKLFSTWVDKNTQVIFKFLFIITTFFNSFQIRSQDISFHGYEALFTSPQHYTIYKSVDSLVIDGKATEHSWQKAAWSAYFVDIEGDKQVKPSLATRFKMIWNQQALYIYAELEELHSWANLTKHDEVIFNDNDFEIFIDPDGDTHNYFEIEVNALATVFDLFLPKPYRNAGSAFIPWNALGLQVKTSIDGSLNKANDIDRKWYVELAIPFQSISLGNEVQVPTNGSLWRINFSRVEWDVVISDHEYKKKIDPTTKKSYPEHNWVWSPQGIVNMHYPERWGYALYSSKDVGSENNIWNLPFSEQMKKYLWLVYYKQVDYKHNNKSYAPSLQVLKIFSDQLSINGNACLLKMESTANQFMVTIQKNDTGDEWLLNHEGLIIKK